MTAPAQLPCRLTRRDPARNMARYYSIALQPTLFGEIALLRSWGRIGRPGQSCIETFAQPEAALARAEQVIQTKTGRGYGRST